MITAYVDESGQEQANWMCVAGFMTNDETWERFLPEWRAAISPRPHLHMKKLRFKKESERIMLEKAAHVSKLFELVPVFGRCRPADVEDMIRGSGRERLLSGYVMCCTALVLQVVMQLPEGERFTIILEQQDRYERVAQVALQSISSAPELRMPDGRGKLASWRFIPKRNVAGEATEASFCEPADYLAYAFTQTWRDPLSRKSQWCRPILAAHNFAGVGAVMERSIVRQILTNAVALLEAKEMLEGLTSD